MLKIVDLEVGNIGSVVKAIKHLGINYELINDPKQLQGATKIILPGVGSFSSCSDKMFASGFGDALAEKVNIDKTPILGICVGMQMLAKYGVEGGGRKGLGFIDASVNRLDDFDKSLVIPHMGWNDIDIKGFNIFKNVPLNSCFYFVHSYEMKVNDNEGLNIVYTDYGNPVVAYINKDNIHGAQFHPEKSQTVGLQFLRNFIELC
jgi:glutamine amidotransferase